MHISHTHLEEESQVGLNDLKIPVGVERARSELKEGVHHVRGAAHVGVQGANLHINRGR